MGLVKELKNWLKVGMDGNAEAAGRTSTRCATALHDGPRSVHPPDLRGPGGGEEPLPVASALGVREELAAINKRYRIDDTFAIRKMVEYMDATERDIAIYEQRPGRAGRLLAEVRLRADQEARRRQRRQEPAGHLRLTAARLLDRMAPGIPLVLDFPGRPVTTTVTGRRSTTPLRRRWPPR
jgi:hypothetical protein